MIKQSDIAMIILVISISLLASFFLGNSLLNKPSNRSTEIEIVPVISTEFSLPNDKIFNDNAVNPTQLIQIGDTVSDQPFPEGQN